ncbi:hypothetical protein BJX63DRAFT_412571 [Aspergillus granulosus]|uniref:Uncharacterized protein n=1 Tax=Aspergillus granulosus TaxID=176169 RepID=A0ABR4GWE4_9EURO
MSLIARLQERAMDKSIRPDTAQSGATIVQPLVRGVTKHASREKYIKRTTKKQPSRQLPLTSTILRSSGGLAISLRGDDLRRLLLELQRCRASDATVHIFVHEGASEPTLRFEMQRSSLSTGSSVRTSTSPAPSILDTLRATTNEGSFPKHMTGPESFDERGFQSNDEDCSLDGAPKAYMISADLSDTEWDEFTTL